MKIRAAVLEKVGLPQPYAQSRPVTIAQVDLDPPGEGEVLVRIAAAGLCHSDLSIINGSRPRPMPLALGHEAAGVVEEVGPGVRDLRKGDHVIFVFVPSCGSCTPCAEGRPALCEPAVAAAGAGTLLSGAQRIHRDGTPINHQVGVSSFAEYATASRRSLIKVDADIPLEYAALFGCAVLTGVGAVVNCAQVRAGATVGIVGLGGVGLAALLGAIAAGASRLVGIDLLDSKLALAKSLGATETFNANKTDCVDAARAATAGGVDYCLDFTGAAEGLALAYKLTRRGGVTVTAGLPPPDATFALPAVHLVAEERTLKGSYLGSAVPVRDIPRYIALYRQGRLPVDRLLTGRLRLDEINLGFDRLANGEAIRQVVTF
ncbi:MAG: alcohol dehydrogenase [Candidatus Muproteobacteria bacterium RBG_16_60_9]|uniref:Alcohol dehydrogenase n=1 Tax=Candidatus Muproteobacteria bacterium RBG_16_60_9 TaxID=1817755 RepID=A0A1F6V5D6_9PROT|nr:MAG: alcohol dehydrogenase [Candidatus Muproteobacteria bacterium RBG_16_60_9]